MNFKNANLFALAGVLCLTAGTLPAAAANKQRKAFVAAQTRHIVQICMKNGFDYGAIRKILTKEGFKRDKHKSSQKQNWTLVKKDAAAGALSVSYTQPCAITLGVGEIKDAHKVASKQLKSFGYRGQGVGRALFAKSKYYTFRKGDFWKNGNSTVSLEASSGFTAKGKPETVGAVVISPVQSLSIGG